MKKLTGYLNVYQAKEGRFISDKEFDTYLEAYKNRDETSSYVETIYFYSCRRLRKKIEKGKDF